MCVLSYLSQANQKYFSATADSEATETKKKHSKLLLYSLSLYLNFPRIVVGAVLLRNIHLTTSPAPQYCACASSEYYNWLTAVKTSLETIVISCVSSVEIWYQLREICISERSHNCVVISLLVVVQLIQLHLYLSSQLVSWLPLCLLYEGWDQRSWWYPVEWWAATATSLVLAVYDNILGPTILQCGWTGRHMMTENPSRQQSHYLTSNKCY